MKYKTINLLLTIITLMLLASCQSNPAKVHKTKSGNGATSVRHAIDTVGFAQYDWQMDSIMARIKREQGQQLEDKLSYSAFDSTGWKVAISPHDDYAYVGYLYPSVLKNMKAKTIILIGVAHKAKKLNLENQIIFDSFDYWKEPYGNVKVSAIRNEIMEQLPDNLYQVNDSMQQLEHSVEAIIPFLQYENRDIEIVSILVPYMNFQTMGKIAKPLAKAIQTVTNKRNWQWGKDFALLISTDAVHYGDEGWGDKNFAFYGIGTEAYQATKLHEYDIIKSIAGDLTPSGVKKFNDYTVDQENYKKYKWTWCGRYSVPLGLLTACRLQELSAPDTLFGTAIGYSSSIEQKPLHLEDISMGVTAPANEHHWVGYAAIGYK